MSDKQSIAFVRTEMLPQQEPPDAALGPVKWIKDNLFPDVLNSIMTVIALYIIFQIVFGLWPWVSNGLWTTSSLAECREILQGTVGGCFSVLTERWNQLLFGFQYPSEEYWRPGLAFVLLFVAIAPLLFAMYVPRVLLFFTGVYPFLAYWLIWGGTILVPIVALLGLVVGFLAFTRFERSNGFAVGLAAAVFGAVVIWWVGGFVSDALSGLMALPVVESRNMGGFMLNFILGVTCVSLSLPLGIVLALGRQSNMIIIKWICVVFIEFIRGVPLITLLFVANVVLAYFFPPDANIDLILRVIIMITLFSAAYIAEVIRGGLAALPRGQYEAADSLGLDYPQAMRLIIMPQALKISIPGIVNVAVGLFKDTTLVSVISMFDLVGMIRGPILASTEWNGVYWELWGFAILLFFPICYGISQYSQWLERQLATDHR
jgi:general L-amino acid transport system permease protein